MMQIMQSPSSSKTAILVRNARRKLDVKQGVFARIIGKSQAVVSRYEKGTVEPPGDVVMRCMHILSGIDARIAAPTDTLDELLTALETAAALVRGLRDATADLTSGDGSPDNFHLPRQA